MTFELHRIEYHIANLRTRFPFKYGIASLEVVPHLFVRVELTASGERAFGTAADSLAPKWFTKVAERPFQEEIEEMIEVITRAGDRALERGGAGSPATDFYSFWRALYEAGRAENLPPLLTSFGSSMIERAVLDALCRAWNTPFAELVRGGESDRLGIPTAVADPSRLPAPRRSVIARHTVGLGDPLTPADIAEPVDDGLPHSLDQCIAAYGLSHFKLKLCGTVERDVDRMSTIADLLDGRDFAFTLDGNEQYREVAAFREMWAGLAESADLSRLCFVEQPFHRDVALSDETGRELRAWAGRPPMIIDESDGELESAAQALAAGYVGTSHKNCKGVIKGLINACAFAARSEPTVMSGEDLVNVGPVALLQDLAVAATLGVEHVERNGHHYFRGLGQFPDALQEQVMRHHDDLYERGRIDVPTVAIRDGRVSVGSLIDAPFGCNFVPELAGLVPLADWRYEMLV